MNKHANKKVAKKKITPKVKDRFKGDSDLKAKIKGWTEKVEAAGKQLAMVENQMKQLTTRFNESKVELYAVRKAMEIMEEANGVRKRNDEMGGDKRRAVPEQ